MDDTTATLDAASHESLVRLPGCSCCVSYAHRARMPLLRPEHCAPLGAVMRGPTMDDSDPGRGRTNLQAARMQLLRPAHCAPSHLEPFLIRDGPPKWTTASATLDAAARICRPPGCRCCALRPGCSCCGPLAPGASAL